MKSCIFKITSEQHLQLRMRSAEQETTMSKLIIDACIQANLFDVDDEKPLTREEEEIKRLDALAALPPAPSVPLTPDGNAVDFAAMRAMGKLRNN